MKNLTVIAIAILILSLFSSCAETPSQEDMSETSSINYSDEIFSENKPVSDDNSVAKQLEREFVTFVESDGITDAQTIADRLLASSVISFSGVASPVSTDMITGFGEAEISGFSNAVSFAPMISTIPFMGYIFELDDNTDKQAFIKNLEDSADMSWNKCTSADETVITSSGNIIFFVMAPVSF